VSRELYAAVSGGSAAWKRLDTVAQNLANASTDGFRGSRVTFEMFDSGAGLVRARDPVADLRDGAVRTTGNAMDVALQGRGWLAVEGPEGTLLTRDGRLRVSESGQLTTSGGLPVQGEDGTIEIPPGEAVRFGDDGTVWAEHSGRLGRLRLVDAQATAAGGNLWRPTGEVTTAAVRVVGGALESSNVDALGAMVELVHASRAFEAFQQAIRGSDELDARLNEKGGR
jgi:flagellar basal-body rod protein FlgF